MQQEVQKALRDVSAPEALVLAIGAAIGKQTMMDNHFVNDATKFLYDKSTNLKGELATFNELLEEYAKKTRTLEATVEELTNDANARTEETIEAKKHQKECIAVRFPTAIGIHVTLCGHIRVLSSEISLVRPYSR